MQYRPEIDGLRAIAVLPVIFFHAGIGIFGGGFVGVDIFFVISGYLITSILIKEIETKTFRFKDFYNRRARRILPALFLVTAITIPIAWFILTPSDLSDFAESVLSVSSFSSNILFWYQSGYFDASAELKPLLHTWSLAVEEQYYIFYPILLIAIWNYGRRWTYSVLIIIFIISLFLSQWLSSHNPSTAFYLLPMRAWELILGGYAAFYTNRHLRIIKQSNAQVFSLIGIAVIFFSIFFFDKSTPTPSLFTTIPTAGALLVIIFSVKGTVVNYFLSRKTLISIGLISYSAYLWHQPLLAFVKYYMFYGNEDHQGLSNTLLISVLIAIFILSYLSWRFVEKPFRNKDHVNDKSALRLLAVFLVGLTLFSSLLIWNKGFPNRFESHPLISVGNVDHRKVQQYLIETFPICEQKNILNDALMYISYPLYKAYPRCRQSKPGQPVDIALIGDSHAEHLFIGLAENLKKSNVAYFIKGEVPFVTNTSFNKIFSYILDSQTIKTVIISMTSKKARALKPSLIYIEDFKSTIYKLVNGGKQVIIINDVPRFSFEAEECLYLGKNNDEFKCKRQDVDPNFPYEQGYSSVLDSFLTIPGVEYVDIREEFCDGSICSMKKGNAILYHDSHHLNIVGSRFAGNKIVKKSTFLH